MLHRFAHSFLGRLAWNLVEVVKTLHDHEHVVNADTQQQEGDDGAHVVEGDVQIEAETEGRAER